MVDPDVERLRDSWKTVRILQARITAVTRGGHIFVRFAEADRFAQVPTGLLLLFATSVLEESLLQLRKSGRFTSRASGLETLMKASRKALDWKDYAAVDAARVRRNDLAHRALLPDEIVVIKDLKAIARELVAWGILEHDFRGNYGISMAPTS